MITKNIAQLQKLSQKKSSSLSEEEKRAEHIIRCIPQITKSRAEQGENHAIIMPVRHNDYKRPPCNKRFDYLSPAWLKGAAKTVYEYCENSGYQVTLQYWEQGEGIESGHDLVISW